MFHIDQTSARLRAELNKLYYGDTTGDDIIAADRRTEVRAHSCAGHSFPCYSLAATRLLLIMLIACFGLAILSTSAFDFLPKISENLIKALPKPAPFIYDRKQHEEEPIVTEGVPGLQALDSCITGIVDPASLSAVYYWTFVLKNDSSQDREAQLDIALPAGAVVSRATLWVNGFPQEAAFSSTEAVTGAYTWITERHRDPLLITQKAPGRILVKASPILAGGKMKLRIGITAPLLPGQGKQAQVMLPHIVSTNLAVDCRQDIHLQSPSLLYSTDASASIVKNNAKEWTWKANTKVNVLNDLSVTVLRPQALNRFAVRATHSNPAGFVLVQLCSDPQSGQKIPVYAQVSKRPDCVFLKDEDAAYRLSTLWAAAEIERLRKLPGPLDPRANDLANTYRVVSSVSGAVVLELQSDYEYNHLNRDMYRSLVSVPVTNSGDLSTVSATKTAAPMLQGAVNGTVVDQLNRLNSFVANPVDSYSVDQVGATFIHYGGNVANWLLKWDTSQNYFERRIGPITEVPVWLLIMLALLLTWTFAGPVLLLQVALKRALSKQAGAFKAKVLAITWLGCAITFPKA